ncbi:MAG: SdrD B-like domain-containing protein [Sarcina sp.]
MLSIILKDSSLYTQSNEIDLELATSLQKSVDKTQVKLNDPFNFTINASFNGLVGPIYNAQIIDFIPNYLNYTLPPIVPPLQSIIETPVTGGTNLTFDFGTITDSGVSIVLSLGASFKNNTLPGTAFTNQLTQYADGTIQNTATAPPVILFINGNWNIKKNVLNPTPINPTIGTVLTYTIDLTNIGDPGVSIYNVTITDTLPSILSPDLSYTPNGVDISGLDNNIGVIDGTWNGNTLTFNIPNYQGTDYRLTYNAIVTNNAQLNDIITNNATFSVDGINQTTSSTTVRVIPPTSAATLSKDGPTHALPGDFINYNLSFKNSGNIPLTNVILIDTIPPEVIANQVIPGQICSPIACPSLNISIAYELNNNGIFIPLGVYPNNSYSRITLPNPSIGNKITHIKWSFSSIDVGAGSYSSQGQGINGIISSTTTSTQIINNSTLNADGINQLTASITTILDGKNSIYPEKFNNPTSNVIPGEVIKYTLGSYNYWTPYREPVIADLLPSNVTFLGNVLFKYYDFPSNTTIDSTSPNFTNFLTPLKPTIISNYQNTGQTLVRFTFQSGTIIPYLSNLEIEFDVTVNIGATGTIINNNILGAIGDLMLANNGQETTIDSLDLDGDTILNENNLLSNNVANGINFSTSISSYKEVKGALDSVYTKVPNVGSTTPGGTINYKLTLTNTGNVNLESFEIIDILPHIGDTGVILTNDARLSQFNIYQITTITPIISPILPGTPQPLLDIEYSTSYDPIRFSQNDLTGNSIGTGTWQSTIPVPITATAAFKLTSVNTILKPGQSIIIYITCVAPLGTPVNLITWNSFALRASYIDSNGNLSHLLPVEPQKTGIQINSPSSQLASLGNFVWYDLNANGIQDTNEIGINGVTINLYDSTGSNLISTTVTAPDFNGNSGFYMFSNLNPGCYIVEFIKPDSTYFFSSQFQGTDITIDSNPNTSTGLTPPICLIAREYNDTVDAGLYQQALIGDFVWIDTNQNGIQDPGEIGKYGVNINLLDLTGNILSVTKTDTNGNYNFIVNPGCYQIQFIRPNSYQFTLQNAGNDPTKDSNPNPTTGITPVFCILAGEQNLTIDAGIYLIPCPYRQAVNDIIESIALEENGLSSIINSEGLKIQKAVQLGFNSTDLIAINESVAETLKIISKLEILLQYKLEVTDDICPK